MRKLQYIIPGIFLMIFVLLIVLKEVKGNYYTISAKEVHKLSLKENVFINENNSKEFENTLIIEISKDAPLTHDGSNEIIRTTLSGLMKKSVLRSMKNHSGIILVKSDSQIESANAWFVLQRKGFNNIRIIHNSTKELKFEFQPDTVAGLK